MSRRLYDEEDELFVFALVPHSMNVFWRYRKERARLDFVILLDAIFRLRLNDGFAFHWQEVVPYFVVIVDGYFTSVWIESYNGELVVTFEIP